MKNRFLILFFSSIFVLGCGTKQKVEIPAGILSRKKMVSVLVKMNLLEASINLNAAHDGRINTTSSYFDPLREEKISVEQYNKSFDFYSHHPALMDSIYEDVLNEFSKQKAEVLKR